MFYVVFIYLFGDLRRFQHCTGHITTGSWKGRGNQNIEFARVLYCKLLTNGKQLPPFPHKALTGIEPRPQRWEARVLPLCHPGPVFYVVTELQKYIMLFTLFFRLVEMHISAMYVKFNSTLRLIESMTIPPLSKRKSIVKVKGVLKNHVNNVKDISVCGDILSKFTTSIIGCRILVQTEPKQHAFPVLSTNTKHVLVTLTKKHYCRKCADIFPLSGKT